MQSVCYFSGIKVLTESSQRNPMILHLEEGKVVTTCLHLVPVVILFHWVLDTIMPLKQVKFALLSLPLLSEALFLWSPGTLRENAMCTLSKGGYKRKGGRISSEVKAYIDQTITDSMHKVVQTLLAAKRSRPRDVSPFVEAVQSFFF